MKQKTPNTSNGHTPRWQRRRDARPAEIVAAALDLFVDRGFAATKMDEIAARAGVTKGTLYLYFGSKEDLLRAAIEQSLVPLMNMAEESLESHTGSARDLLESFIRTWAATITKSPVSGIPKLITSEAANFPVLAREFAQTVGKRVRAVIRAVLERGIESGEFREMNVDAAVRVALAPITAFVIHKHSLACYEEGDYNIDELVNLHIETFLRGIAKEAQ